MKVPIQNLERIHGPLRDELRSAIDRVIESGTLVMGPELSSFEAEVAQFLGTRHAIGVANGTAALELALRAIDVHDRVVVTTAFSFASTATAILAAGGRPVFVDIDPTTFNMNADEAANVMARERARAVIPVHLFGTSCELDPLLDCAAAIGAYVVEDAAQAFGAVTGDRRVGTIGHIGCFSFFPTKNLGAMGQGGLIVTQDEEIAARIRSLREPVSSGRSYPGATNARLDEIQSTVLRSKLPHVDRWNGVRRQLAAVYHRELCELANLNVPATPTGSVVHQYVVRVAERHQIRAELSAAGVETRVYYETILPEIIGHAETSGTYPVASTAAREVLALPLYPGLRPDEQAHVIRALSGALSGRAAAHEPTFTRPCDHRRINGGSMSEVTCVHPRVHLMDRLVTPAICGTCEVVAPSESDQPTNATDQQSVEAPSRPQAQEFRWAVGMTTAPRRDPTIEASLTSMAEAGWPTPRLFVEPETDLPAVALTLPLTSRDDRLGAFPNWFLALSELYQRNPHADGFLICQDDVLLSRGTRNYLERSLWPAPEVGVVSVYCPAHHAESERDGFQQVDAGWDTWGALAYVFPNPSVRALLADIQVINHRHHGPGQGDRNIDSVVGNWCRRTGRPYFVHWPSLAEHIGGTSTIWRHASIGGKRRAGQFLDAIDMREELRNPPNGRETEVALDQQSHEGR